MNYLQITILIILPSLNMQAQSIKRSVIASAGQTFSNGGATLKATTGEAITYTLSNANYKIRQGFHQGIQSNTPLPVSLGTFSGKIIKEGNFLEWATSSEKNNNHFLLQRSANAVDFETIALVNSKGIQGNSSIVLKYNFTDQNPINGVNYYRLKQVDIDGKSTLSQIINLTNAATQQSVSAYPNPVQNTLVVESTSRNEIILINSLGQILLKKNLESFGKIFKTTIDFSKSAAGIYYIKSGDQILKVIK